MESFESAGNDRDGIQISLSAVSSAHPFDKARLLAVSRRILNDAGYQTACISVAVVDDEAIHELNRRFLDHDYPTDVLSFPLEDQGHYLEGEVVASAETAAREAAERGYPADAELSLYVIHGLLHLVGYRDTSEEDAARMRTAEKHYLELAGITPAPSANSSAGERQS